MQTSKHFTQYKYYPVLVIMLSALFLIYKYVLQVAPGIMSDQLMRDFHVSAAGLGNLAAMFFYSYFIMQLFVGVLLDKFSPRYLTSAAIIFCAIGIYIFSRTHQLWIASIGRACIGVGVAFATVSYMKMAAIWFEPEHFAFVGGLLATAAMAGAIFGEAPLSLLVGALGWRESLLICAGIGLVIGVLYFVLVRDHHRDENNDVTTIKQGFSFRDVADAFKSKQNWILTFYSGLAFTPVAVFGGLWGVPFLKVAYRLHTTQAASLVSCVFLGLAFGGPILGLISDRLRSRLSVMKVGAAISFLSVISIIYFQNIPLWVVSVLLFIFGFATGAFMLGFALGREMNKLALAATIIAMINTGDGIFGSFTEPLIGKILDLRWNGVMIDGVRHFSLHSYHGALTLMPIYLLLAFILLFFLREKSWEI